MPKRKDEISLNGMVAKAEKIYEMFIWLNPQWTCFNCFN